MFAWTRATGKNISRCRMSTKNSIGTGLQRPVEISFSLMTMSNSVVSPTLNVSSDMLPAHRPPPFFRSLAADRFFINIDSNVIPFNFYLLCKILFFYSNYNVSPFNEFVSRFLHLPKKKKKKRKGERSGGEANYRVQASQKAPISARQTSIIVPEEAFVSAYGGRIRRPAPRLALSNFGIKARRERFSVN